MAKLHSGMDAWRYIVRSENKRLPVEGYLPLILSAAGALGVLPFAIRRFMEGEWLAGVIDAILIIGFLALGAYVFRTRRVRLASITLAVLAVGGVLATVYLNGPQQVFWVFPALVGVFYLIRLREAIACALITVFALIPPMLAAGDPFQTTTALITIVITSVLAVAFSMITNRQRSQLLQLATKDPLTGAGNRRALDSKLRDVVNAFQRTGTPASLLMLDLDHFKTVNDILGHAAGDEILKNVTEIINLRIRVTDSLYRIGGEEFVVVLEGADVEHAAHLAEQLRTLVDANELVPEHTVTISLGVAELRKSESPYDWLHRADEAMYRAKDAGRNSTSVSD
jgi:diguanylate cyclase (GGDEF)-like protein